MDWLGRHGKPVRSRRRCPMLHSAQGYEGAGCGRDNGGGRARRDGGHCAAGRAGGGGRGRGFARFGYALLLPPMRAELGWSYAQAGGVNSANALGYLAGALGVGAAVARWGAAWVLRVSLVAVSLSLIVSGLVDSYWVLLLARVVSGAGAGLIFVAGAAAVLTLAAEQRSSPDTPLGVYYAGPGIGIALSGLLIPLLLGPLGWRWPAVWVVLGVLGLLALPLIELPLRQLPPHVRRSGAGRGLFVGAGLPGALAQPDRLRPVRAGLHRLHDLCDRLPARHRRRELDGPALLGAARLLRGAVRCRLAAAGGSAPAALHHAHDPADSGGRRGAAGAGSLSAAVHALRRAVRRLISGGGHGGHQAGPRAGPARAGSPRWWATPRRSSRSGS